MRDPGSRCRRRLATAGRRLRYCGRRHIGRHRRRRDAWKRKPLGRGTPSGVPNTQRARNSAEEHAGDMGAYGDRATWGRSYCLYAEMGGVHGGPPASGGAQEELRRHQPQRLTRSLAPRDGGRRARRSTRATWSRGPSSCSNARWRKRSPSTSRPSSQSGYSATTNPNSAGDRTALLGRPLSLGGRRSGVGEPAARSLPENAAAAGGGARLDRA